MCKMVHFIIALTNRVCRINYYIARCAALFQTIVKVQYNNAFKNILYSTLIHGLLLLPILCHSKYCTLPGTYF